MGSSDRFGRNVFLVLVFGNVLAIANVLRFIL